MSRFVAIQFTAVREPDMEDPANRNPCEGCAYHGGSPDVCRVMRKLLTTYGLPDCMGGFIYKEEVR
jgi:hypothetical protein